MLDIDRQCTYNKTDKTYIPLGHTDILGPFSLDELSLFIDELSSNFATNFGINDRRSFVKSRGDIGC